MLSLKEDTNYFAIRDNAKFNQLFLADGTVISFIHNSDKIRLMLCSLTNTDFATDTSLTFEVVKNTLRIVNGLGFVIGKYTIPLHSELTDDEDEEITVIVQHPLRYSREILRYDMVEHGFGRNAVDKWFDL